MDGLEREILWKWMIWGTPILGNFHMYAYMSLFLRVLVFFYVELSWIIHGCIMVHHIYMAMDQYL